MRGGVFQDIRKTSLRRNTKKKTTTLLRIFGVGIFLTLLITLRQNGLLSSWSNEKSIINNKSSSSKYSRFPTIVEAEKLSEIIALYFAAPWSYECEKVTNDLDFAFSFSEYLLTPVDLLSIKLGMPDAEQLSKTIRPLSIIFISSGTSITEDVGYGSEEWLHVPSDTGERIALKKLFQTCSADEAKKYNIEKKFDIPRLVLIDARTKKTLSTNGVEEITEHGSGAYEIWKKAREDQT